MTRSTYTVNTPEGDYTFPVGEDDDLLAVTREVVHALYDHGAWATEAAWTLLDREGKVAARGIEHIPASARAWADQADAGEYLAKFVDDDGEDPGSRCGYSDEQLDEAADRLARRGLRLTTDDVGILARKVSP